MSHITATKVADYLQLPRAAGYITGDTLQITLLLACYMRAVAHERGVFDRLRIVCHTSASVSIRQHMSAYVSIRQHTSAYVSLTALGTCQMLPQPSVGVKDDNNLVNVMEDAKVSSPAHKAPHKPQH